MRLKKLTKLLLVMVISLVTILALSVCASADVNNGTGGGQAGIENAKKGIGVDDIGYRFYLTDLDGKLMRAAEKILILYIEYEYEHLYLVHRKRCLFFCAFS